MRACVSVRVCFSVQEKPMFEWLIMQKCVSCVCMSVFQPAPKHTILSVAVNSWPYQHDGCTTTSSVLQFSHVKSLTWLSASSCHPDSAAKSPRLILLESFSVPLPFTVHVGQHACCPFLRVLVDHKCDWEYFRVQVVSAAMELYLKKKKKSPRCNC